MCLCAKKIKWFFSSYTLTRLLKFCSDLKPANVERFPCHLKKKPLFPWSRFLGHQMMWPATRKIPRKWRELMFSNLKIVCVFSHSRSSCCCIRRISNRTLLSPIEFKKTYWKEICIRNRRFFKDPRKRYNRIKYWNIELLVQAFWMPSS